MTLKRNGGERWTVDPSQALEVCLNNDLELRILIDVLKQHGVVPWDVPYGGLTGILFPNRHFDEVVIRDAQIFRLLPSCRCVRLIPAMGLRLPCREMFIKSKATTLQGETQIWS